MKESKAYKELTITYKLSYEPILKYSQSGNCKMKCPLGDCILNVVLENSLDKVVQSVDVKAEREILEADDDRLNMEVTR